MRVSVVFGTRGTNMQLLERIFHCLKEQTFQEFKVIMVVDNDNISKEFRTLEQKFSKDFPQRFKVYTALNSEFIPHSKGRASYVRNFGLQQVDTALVQLFDDDNEFDEKYLEKTIKKYDEMKKLTGKEVVICPTLQWRNTEIVQNQGFSRFLYWQSRPMMHRLGTKKFEEIQMFSGNGLLGSAQLFQSVGFDEEIAWIAEDMDFTLSLHEKGAKLFVFSDLVVRHYERDKTKLEQAWIGSSEQACQKARNWFLFLRKHGKFWDKTTFWLIGLPGCLVWLSMKALRYGGKQRWKIIGGLFRGCREGWKRMESSQYYH
ncbi:MAG: glycosyltransferase [Candidatus Peribacteria bacterium]|jgi:GT2 family glycosyltransferase|nr:glycosyltransferase [Candidatus Peribacteria bacterium]